MYECLEGDQVVSSIHFSNQIDRCQARGDFGWREPSQPLWIHVNSSWRSAPLFKSPLLMISMTYLTVILKPLIPRTCEIAQFCALKFTILANIREIISPSWLWTASKICFLNGNPQGNLPQWTKKLFLKAYFYFFSEHLGLIFIGTFLVSHYPFQGAVYSWK